VARAVAYDQQHDPKQVSTRPKVSVCLLTYNHRHIVESVLQSILKQTFSNFELIVSDDCSTDGTYAALLAFAATDPRLRIVQPPSNLGMAGNANFAAAQARGEYIALLHHDDIYSERLIEAWAGVLDRNPTAGFVSNSYLDHSTGRLYLHPFRERNHGKHILRHAMLPVWGCPVRGTAMIRKRCWEAVGGMREQFGMLADVDLWMRLAARYDLGYVPEALIVVRHDRPDYYPDAYWRWSWPRLKLTYAIYGTHHESFYGDSWRGRAHREVYRARVNADIVKWLGYALVKRRRDILQSSDEVANSYEYWPVSAARKLLRRLSVR
jgi:glycosyltransferase involved in cell wall biosynthesis